MSKTIIELPDELFPNADDYISLNEQIKLLTNQLEVLKKQYKATLKSMDLDPSLTYHTTPFSFSSRKSWEVRQMDAAAIIRKSKARDVALIVPAYLQINPGLQKNEKHEQLMQEIAVPKYSEPAITVNKAASVKKAA